MDILVAHADDPAGRNMARHLSGGESSGGRLFSGPGYDVLEIPTPAVSADAIELERGYDGYVFLSRHYSATGTLALTCHSTGNFTQATLGGGNRQVAVPYPSLQKTYLRMLMERQEEFADFHITIEATHHGPTALPKRSLFIEVGTTPQQWEDAGLCGRVADVVDAAVKRSDEYPVGICFGGTHYPDTFTRELLYGEFALGTVVPKRYLEYLDGGLFSHILRQNAGAKAALLDWGGLGSHKRRLLNLLEDADLEVVRL